jgi:hypothetical protein
LFVAAVEDFEVVAINIVADEDIGDEFQNRRLADTSLANKKDGVWRLNLVFRCLDDPLLERLYIARKYGQNRCIKNDIVTYLIGGVLFFVIVFRVPCVGQQNCGWRLRHLEDRPSQ